MLLFYFATQHSPLFKESKMKPRNQILQQGWTNKQTQQQATTVIQKNQKVKIKQKLKTHQKIQNYTNSALSCGGHQCAEPETCRKKEHASTSSRGPTETQQMPDSPSQSHSGSTDSQEEESTALQELGDSKQTKSPGMTPAGTVRVPGHTQESLTTQSAYPTTHTYNPSTPRQSRTLP